MTNGMTNTVVGARGGARAAAVKLLRVAQRGLYVECMSMSMTG